MANSRNGKRLDKLEELRKAQHLPVSMVVVTIGLTPEQAEAAIAAKVAEAQAASETGPIIIMDI